MIFLFRTVSCRHIVHTAILVAVIVGTILILINQSGALSSGDGISWPYIFMSYLMPYFVASYSEQTDKEPR
jgi:hypothetical protein